jgi:hypothetical protein
MLLCAPALVCTVCHAVMCTSSCLHRLSCCYAHQLLSVPFVMLLCAPALVYTICRAVMRTSSFLPFVMLLCAPALVCTICCAVMHTSSCLYCLSCCYAHQLLSVLFVRTIFSVRVHCYWVLLYLGMYWNICTLKCIVDHSSPTVPPQFPHSSPTVPPQFPYSFLWVIWDSSKICLFCTDGIKAVLYDCYELHCLMSLLWWVKNIWCYVLYDLADMSTACSNGMTEAVAWNEASCVVSPEPFFRKWTFQARTCWNVGSCYASQPRFLCYLPC